jgi:hypothetical protein
MKAAIGEASMRGSRIVFGTAIAGLMLATAPAYAAMITQSKTFNGQTFQSTHFGGIFDQFDPALGTLDTVTLNFSGNISYFTNLVFVGDCDNTLIGICAVESHFSTGYNFNAPGFPIRFFTSAPFYAVVNGGFVGAGPDLVTDTWSSIFGFGPLSLDPSALSQYIGTGFVDVNGGISEDSDVCIAYGYKCTQTDNLKLTTTLTYGFTPVPEPLTLGVFGVGLLGTAALRRRRHSLSKPARA